MQRFRKTGSSRPATPSTSKPPPPADTTGPTGPDDTADARGDPEARQLRLHEGGANARGPAPLRPGCWALRPAASCRVAAREARVGSVRDANEIGRASCRERV